MRGASDERATYFTPGGGLTGTPDIRPCSVRTTAPSLLNSRAEAKSPVLTVANLAVQQYAGGGEVMASSSRAPFLMSALSDMVWLMREYVWVC